MWERHQSGYTDDINWDETRIKLQEIRNSNVTVIAGLVHHGSGPAFTNLADPGFASGLAQYARKVALEFPWIDHYTPVNEPLTTARFSGLYGHWYPHHRNDESFLRMLVNQVKGIVLSYAGNTGNKSKRKTCSNGRPL